jgi:2-hydroxy-3-keto-5-methylthiopentenyl-1-phosphate phosphatase
VVIGDGLADLPGAKIADMVFATGNLVKLMEQENINSIYFNNFYEVKEQLQQKLQQKLLQKIST